MAMDRINGSNFRHPSSVDKFSGNDQDPKSKKVDENKPDSVRPAKPADTMEISDAARRMVDLRSVVDSGRDAISELPDIRAEKVELARQRLEKGYYNSVQVRDQLAEKLGAVFDAMDEL